jgi:hypothetical protein
MIKKIKNKIRVVYKKSRAGLHYLSLLKKPIIIAKPRIIFCCDGLFSHGGLLDRIKGIVSFYEVAKILDYDFYIYFNSPFQLNDFLEPNTVSWKIEDHEMNFSVFDTKIIYRMNDFDLNPIDEIKNSKAQNYLVYANVDYLAALYIHNSQQDNEILWRSNFNELFCKSSLLVNELVSLPSDKRLVFHLRFTSLMGDFRDTTQKILNIEERGLLIDKIIEKIKERVVHHPNEAIYILSDSRFFLAYIKKYTKYTVLAGDPEHLDFVSDSAISHQSHLKTFSDFFFMSESNYIVAVRMDAMYTSSFSRYAAILGNKPFLIIQ